MPDAQHLLIIQIEEPAPQSESTPTFTALADDFEEAEKRYRALITVMLQQLEGLTDCHVRFHVSPADATEAVAFWILPLLRGSVKMEGSIYHFTPQKNAPSISVEFCCDSSLSENTDHFVKSATLNPFCIECSARWINMAFLQTKPEQSICGTDYLEVNHKGNSASCQPSLLPDLPIIKSEADWKNALTSPIGGKLKKVYQML